MPEKRRTRHFDIDGTELPSTYYEVSDEQIEAEIDAEAREVAIQKIAEVEKAAIRAKRVA